MIRLHLFLWHPGHTGQAIEQVGGAAASLARSVNELGQTRVPIAGKHSEMYDGPDLEKGISFAITAERIARRPLRLSEKALTNAVNIGMMTRAATRAFKDHDIAEKEKILQERSINLFLKYPDVNVCLFRRIKPEQKLVYLPIHVELSSM